MLDYLLYNDEVEAEHVFALAVQAFVINENPEATAALLEAFLMLIDESKPIRLAGDPDTRYSTYRQAYLQELTGREVDADDETEVAEPFWPDGVEVPKRFVVLVAKIEAQRDKAGMHYVHEMTED